MSCLSWDVLHIQEKSHTQRVSQSGCKRSTRSTFPTQPRITPCADNHKKDAPIGIKNILVYLMRTLMLHPIHVRLQRTVLTVLCIRCRDVQV
jgi:hypothetical protein